MYYHLCCVGLPQSASSGTSNNDSTGSRNSSTTAPGNLNLSHTSGSFQLKPSKFEQDKRSLSDSQLTLKLLPVPTVREESKATFFKKHNFAKNDMEIIEV
jgi:hypothetical protein